MVLVKDPENIRLAILGSSVGNGHPFSWSAIFNGYDPEQMKALCPFPGILDYLEKEPSSMFPFPGARVTHVSSFGDGGFSAEDVAKCSYIPNVVSHPEDVIGQVDAVIVATDRGNEHVERCRPFVEAGVPLFVDKPLVTSRADLKTFCQWVQEGRAIMSSSSMRYAKEFQPYRESTRDLGELRCITITSPKSWEAYGIHALEAVYPIVGPGFETVRNTGNEQRNVVHLTHSRGIDVIALVTSDMYGSFGCLQLCGTRGNVQTRFSDSFYSFRKQLSDFVGYLRTGVRPFPFQQTRELMELVIAGIESRQQGGAVIRVGESHD